MQTTLSYPDYHWQSNTQHPDLAHLSPLSIQAFLEGDTQHITADHLHQFTLANAFAIQTPLVLFGLRACRTTTSYAEWHKSINIQYHAPNHLDPCCLIGLWHRHQHTLAVFPGSTVPNAAWIHKQQCAPHSLIANLLGQGLHQYYTGPHEPDGRPPEEGAWRMNRQVDVGVWRLYEGKSYDLNASFSVSYPDDNIHASHYQITQKPILFSSAGCQVIVGNHQPPQLPTEFYQQFRIMAGRQSIPDKKDTGQYAEYLLIPSAYLYAQIQQNFTIKRLMQGSSGSQVRNVQDYLLAHQFLTDTGFNKAHYHGKTAAAVYAWQKSNQLIADGIIKPCDLEKMKMA